MFVKLNKVIGNVLIDQVYYKVYVYNGIFLQYCGVNVVIYGNVLLLIRFVIFCSFLIFDIVGVEIFVFFDGWDFRCCNRILNWFVE